MSRVDKKIFYHLQHETIGIFNQMEKGKGQEEDEMFLDQGERKRRCERVLPLEKAYEYEKFPAEKRDFQ